MEAKVPIYKSAPVTASTADFLARVYGASSGKDFAKSLPRSAKILDVGAGDSELGRVITSLRPDISWTNLDINYTTAKQNRINEKGPKNLSYLCGDILNPDDLPKSKFDRIYAFWILPHIGIESPDLIRTGIMNMLSLLNNRPNSSLTIGPLMTKRTGVSSHNYPVTDLLKSAPTIAITKVTNDSTISGDQVALYKAMNRSRLVTMKNGERTGQKPTKLGLWDMEHKRYVRALSIRGLLLMARFRIYLTIERSKVARH